MSKHIKLFIDSYTCKRHDVDPERYAKEILSIEQLDEAQVTIHRSNLAPDADYSLQAAVTKTELIGTSVNLPKIQYCLLDLFNSLKGTYPPVAKIDSEKN